MKFIKTWDDFDCSTNEPQMTKLGQKKFLKKFKRFLKLNPSRKKIYMTLAKDATGTSKARK